MKADRKLAEKIYIGFNSKVFGQLTNKRKCDREEVHGTAAKEGGLRAEESGYIEQT